MNAEDNAPSPGGRMVVVVLHVADLDRSASFYREILGLPVKTGVTEPRADPWVGGDHAMVTWVEGAYLRLLLVPARPPHRPHSTGVQIGFRLPDTEGVHRRALAAGADVLHPPREEPWGPIARYLDPDGNLVSVGGEAPGR